MTDKIKVTEHGEQQAVFEWAEWNKGKQPLLELMFAIPNGGHRHIAVAKKMKAEGVKAGVPDIFLAVPAYNAHGLFIEMKVGKNKLSQSQKEWRERLVNQGYLYKVCYGSEEAIEFIDWYLSYV